MAEIRTADVNEIWKRIPDSDKFYEVSNLGRVRNGCTQRVLTPRPTKTGYLRVHISIGDGRKDFYIHRLVADAFCAHPEGYNVVNHLDSNPQNNRADNLEWTTQQRNLIYAMEKGNNPHFMRPVIGLKNEQEYYFNSTMEAQRETGCFASNIQQCCMGNRKTIHGYEWRYATKEEMIKYGKYQFQ